MHAKIRQLQQGRYIEILVAIIYLISTLTFYVTRTKDRPSIAIQILLWSINVCIVSLIAITYVKDIKYLQLTFLVCQIRIYVALFAKTSIVEVELDEAAVLMLVYYFFGLIVCVMNLNMYSKLYPTYRLQI